MMSEDNKHKCISKGDLLEMTRMNIGKYGLQVVMVHSTGYSPSFAYSIGLTKTYNHPELICFGLPDDLVHSIINDVAEIVKKGATIEVGKIYTEIFKNSRAAFLKVDKKNMNDYFDGALSYYGKQEFDAFQLVWTDRNDVFPWEENAEKVFLYKQPLLDRNASFKFNEPENLTVFTTRQWVEDKEPIIRVVHDNEGDWQFLTGNPVQEDIRIVALEELVRRDLTLNGVFDLEYGQEAWRDFAGGQWTRNKVEDAAEE